MRLSQKARILSVLRAAGLYGVRSYDLINIAYRYSARIYQLRADGHRVLTLRTGKNEFRFVLLEVK